MGCGPHSWQLNLLQPSSSASQPPASFFGYIFLSKVLGKEVQLLLPGWLFSAMPVSDQDYDPLECSPVCLPCCSQACARAPLTMALCSENTSGGQEVHIEQDPWMAREQQRNAAFVSCLCSRKRCSPLVTDTHRMERRVASSSPAASQAARSRGRATNEAVQETPLDTAQL